MSFNESPDTYQARRKIKEIFRHENFDIEEEVELEFVTNNMGEEIYPPLRADMLCTKEFIIEFDSKRLHGSKIRRNKDHWRDRNIKKQSNLKTVRLISKDILKQSPEEILKEIDYQLKEKKWQPSPTQYD